MATQDKGNAPIRYDIMSASRQQEDDLESVAGSEPSVTESHLEVPGAPSKRRVTSQRSTKTKTLSFSEKTDVNDLLGHMDDLNELIFWGYLQQR
jgi:hypothetical protein